MLPGQALLTTTPLYDDGAARAGCDPDWIMTARPLKILHVLRAPLGGLLRHVADLTRGQAARGHSVGIVADSRTGGAQGDAILEALMPHLALGVTRVAMSRQIGLRDFTAAHEVGRHIRAIDADVVHGHGAKGAAYARLAAPAHRAIRVYTPHGGSLHYEWGTPAGILYLTLEKVLNRRTDLFLFESEYAARLFRQKVGVPHGLARVVRNGLAPNDFADVEYAADAADLLFIGELRSVKGIDVLLDAMADLRRQGVMLTATIVGSGPDLDDLRRHADTSGLAQAVRFAGAMPAREAFRLGKIAIIPSRAESLPYVVLEYAAAGIPMIATDVGGIAEVFGAQAGRLIPAADAPALARAIGDAVNDPQTMRAQAAALRERVRTEFSVDAMVEAGLAGYAQAIARKLETRNQ
jgi:glycosyltransferase involved in cell wall biosynthesis